MALDPSSWFGSIFGQVLAGILLAGLLALIGMMVGLFRWWWNGRSIQKLLLSGRNFTLVYNPEAGKSKVVAFLAGGKIGEGSNDNEYSWRIKRGQLEIFAFDGNIYSRFKLDRKTGRLSHTNDTDTRSILGQYFVPQVKK